MKKLVYSLIAVFIISLSVVVVSIVISLPLYTLLRFGILSQTPVETAIAVIKSEQLYNVAEWVIIGVQLVLVSTSLISLTIFVKNVVSIIPGLNGYFRSLYSWLFGLIIFLPSLTIHFFVFYPIPVKMILYLLGGFIVIAASIINIAVNRVLPFIEENNTDSILFLSRKS